MKPIKGSDFIAEELRRQGVTSCFEVAGGMITHILDSIAKLGYTKIITVHHEQTASFAADAHARVTGRPAVALATSGPGATNLLTGIGSCYFDSVPAVFITGQVNTHEQRGSRAIRQLGFQETDIVQMAAPITKGAFIINSPEELVRRLPEAFKLAASGRPGPVLLDVAMDVQRALVTEESAIVTSPVLNSSAGEQFLEQYLSALKSAERPLLLLGRGVRAAGETDRALAFAERLGVPIVTSLLAVDAVPATHPLRVGFIGSYGNRWANLSFGRCDLLLVLGSRLDIRQTGADVAGFQEGKRIFHVDCEAGEINNRLSGCESLVLDLRRFFDCADQITHTMNFSDWSEELSALKKKWPDTNEIPDIQGINPNSFMHALSGAAVGVGGYVADVGSHQMWAAQSLQLRAGETFFTSAGMGAMGSALPAAIGAAIASQRPYVVIAGDGGFQMNIQELQTVVRNGLPLKMVVMNNRSLGMIRQFQDSYFDGRHQSTAVGYSAPDFKAVSIAYGIPAQTIESPDEITSGLQFLFRDPTAPTLLQVMIDPRANAYPKIAFGKPITEMEPFSKPLDMEGT